MPPRALKAITQVAAVEDDTTLYSGIKNLALSYYDTTSAFNKIGEVAKHFDFQTVKGLDWQQAVGKIMGTKPSRTLGRKERGFSKRLSKAPSLWGREKRH